MERQRVAATSRVWLGRAAGIGREILVAECRGWTAEATAKARKARRLEVVQLGGSGVLAR